MSSSPRQKPVFRFAPSPNGRLHLGHALSAILNAKMAKEVEGRFLLRFEDIDIARCKPEFEEAIRTDLHWLDLEWETPERQQSEHIVDYEAALKKLKAAGLAYPAFMSRGEVKRWVENYEADGKAWPCDPDGAPRYPPSDRELPIEQSMARVNAGEKHVWRLDMQKAIARLPAPLTFKETGEKHSGVCPANPAEWGDVILWRWDAPSSYHLSVVVDDDQQGVTNIVRGLDLFHATHVHRLLQALLGLAEPLYHHHRLILDESGRKLSKSQGDVALSEIRKSGRSGQSVRRQLGFT